MATNTSGFSTAAFAVLVAATIAAFFVTQHLKVTTPLIQGTPRPVPGVINPLHRVQCGNSTPGRRRSRSTSSTAATTSTCTWSMQDGDDRRTVADGRHMRKDVRNPDGVFHWDGRLADGRVGSGRHLLLPGVAACTRAGRST